MNILIYDEDIRFRILLKEVVASNQMDVQFKFYVDLEKLLYDIKRAPLDQKTLLFVNIDLLIHGYFDLFNKIRKFNPALFIVIASRTSKYAIYAFQIEALDYLIKPITAERISLTLERLNSYACHNIGNIN